MTCFLRSTEYELAVTWISGRAKRTIIDARDGYFQISERLQSMILFFLLIVNIRAFEPLAISFINPLWRHDRYSVLNGILSLVAVRLNAASAYIIFS